MAAQSEPEESGPAVHIQDAHVDPIEDLRGAPGEEDDDGQEKKKAFTAVRPGFKQPR